MAAGPSVTTKVTPTTLALRCLQYRNSIRRLAAPFIVRVAYWCALSSKPALHPTAKWRQSWHCGCFKPVLTLSSPMAKSASIDAYAFCCSRLRPETKCQRIRSDARRTTAHLGSGTIGVKSAVRERRLVSTTWVLTPRGPDPNTAMSETVRV